MNGLRKGIAEGVERPAGASRTAGAGAALCDVPARVSAGLQLPWLAEHPRHPPVTRAAEQGGNGAGGEGAAEEEGGHQGEGGEGGDGVEPPRHVVAYGSPDAAATSRLSGRGEGEGEGRLGSSLRLK